MTLLITAPPEERKRNQILARRLAQHYAGLETPPPLKMPVRPIRLYWPGTRPFRHHDGRRRVGF